MPNFCARSLQNRRNQPPRPIIKKGTTWGFFGKMSLFDDFFAPSAIFVKNCYKVGEVCEVAMFHLPNIPLVETVFRDISKTEEITPESHFDPTMTPQPLHDKFLIFGYFW